MYSTSKIREKAIELIKKVWKGEGIPKNQTKGIIYPIHKKGEIEEVSNYRGITLLNSIYKIYASLLSKRLTEETEKKKLLPEI